MSEKIKIEIIYALPARQERLHLEVSRNATAWMALQQSGWIERHQLDVGQLRCGVFGRVMAWEDVLQDQDRLEIYRPLLADPRQKRLSKVTRKLPRRCT